MAAEPVAGTRDATVRAVITGGTEEAERKTPRFYYVRRGKAEECAPSDTALRLTGSVNDVAAFLREANPMDTSSCLSIFEITPWGFETFYKHALRRTPTFPGSNWFKGVDETFTLMVASCAPR